MKAYIEFIELDVKDVITTSTVTPENWGNGDVTPPTKED